jgi:hypothetical protein
LEQLRLLAVNTDQSESMQLLIDGLENKYQEESEVSRVERGILKSDQSEKG